MWKYDQIPFDIPVHFRSRCSCVIPVGWVHFFELGTVGQKINFWEDMIYDISFWFLVQLRNSSWVGYFFFEPGKPGTVCQIVKIWEYMIYHSGFVAVV